MAQTFADFLENVESLVHPSGIARPLEYQFRLDVISALIRIQKFCKYYRTRNRDVTDFADTTFYCGASVVDMPRGNIQRVYTIITDTGCCPILASHMSDWDEWLNKLQYRRQTYEEPTDSTGLAVPFRHPTEDNDKDCRANYGYWSHKYNKIYLAPWIDSDESVVVEWHGIRRKYEDATVMPYDGTDSYGVGDSQDAGTELLTAVAAFVRSEDLRKNRRDYAGAAYERQVFDDKLADMIHSVWAEEQPKLIGDQFGEQKYDQGVGVACPTETADDDEGGDDVPENALLDENGDPVLDENGDYILVP